MRLQELTREITGVPIPKQYCRLLGEQSLLEATLARTRRFAGPERTVVIVNDNHLDLARAQLATLPSRHLLIQPCNRDTGPGLLFALFSLARVHPTATVAVFPSDHHVDNDRASIRHVERAVRAVTLHPDKIALLGIQPDRHEPGLGYLVPTRPLGATGAFHVAGFWEQPGPETEAELLARIPEHLVVLRVDDLYWSDWGTRESIERTLKTLHRVPPWLRARGAAIAAPEEKRLRPAT